MEKKHTCASSGPSVVRVCTSNNGSAERTLDCEKELSKKNWFILLCFASAPKQALKKSRRGHKRIFHIFQFFAHFSETLNDGRHTLCHKNLGHFVVREGFLVRPGFVQKNNPTKFFFPPAARIPLLHCNQLPAAGAKKPGTQ